jgi:integrase
LRASSPAGSIDGLPLGDNVDVAKRSYGTGSLYTREDSRGRETWYGSVRVNGRLVRRSIGPKRPPGSRDGLTKAQAEARLRALTDELLAAPPIAERLTVAQVGERHLRHLASVGRKRSTLMDYESALRIHLAPFFGELPLESIGQAHVEAFIAEKQRQGRAAKSIRNYLGLLHSIFAFAERRGWSRGNPCKLVDLPDAPEEDADIRFLDRAELEALVRATPDTPLGTTDRVLYLTAAMTGLRQGELLALRWRDIDWPASRVRVRQSYVRGEFGSPKSKRSTRSVPLADGLAGELERHFQASPWQADDDLVFPHPQTGRRSSARGCSSVSRLPLHARACARCASTTCATPSAPEWPAPGCRCAPCRPSPARSSTWSGRSRPSKRRKRRADCSLPRKAAGRASDSARCLDRRRNRHAPQARGAMAGQHFAFSRLGRRAPPQCAYLILGRPGRRRNSAAATATATPSSPASSTAILLSSPCSGAPAAASSGDGRSSSARDSRMFAPLARRGGGAPRAGDPATASSALASSPPCVLIRRFTPAVTPPPLPDFLPVPGVGSPRTVATLSMY